MYVITVPTRAQGSRAAGKVVALCKDIGAAGLALNGFGYKAQVYKVKPAHEETVILGAEVNAYDHPGEETALSLLAKEEKEAIDRTRADVFLRQADVRSERLKTAGNDNLHAAKFHHYLFSRFANDPEMGGTFHLEIYFPSQTLPLPADNVVGNIRYTTRVDGQGKQVIDFQKFEISEKFRRQGIGSKAIQMIQAEHPLAEITFRHFEPGSAAARFIDSLPRFAVEHPSVDALRNEASALRKAVDTSSKFQRGASTPEPMDWRAPEELLKQATKEVMLVETTGRVHECDHLANLIAHTITHYKILNPENTLREYLRPQPDGSVNRSAIAGVVERMSSKLQYKEQPPLSLEEIAVRSEYDAAKNKLSSIIELSFDIQKDANRRLLEQYRQMFAAAFPRRRNYSFAALQASDPSGVENVRNNLQKEGMDLLKAAGCDAVSISDIKKRIEELARTITPRPGNSFRILKSGSSLDYHTQGFGADTYARKSIEVATVEAQAQNVPAIFVGEEIRFPTFDRGSHQSSNCYTQYYTIVGVESDTDLRVMKEAPKAPFKEVLRYLLKNGCNPRVFYPFLEYGFEASIGLDAFGNDIPYAAPQTKPEPSPSLSQAIADRLSDVTKSQDMEPDDHGVEVSAG